MPHPNLSGPSLAPASGQPPKQLILFLHGLGADGEDLMGLAEFFRADFPDAQFISPHAPSPCDMAPYGYQWFSLQDRAMQRLYEGANGAAPILNHYIDQQLAALKLPVSQLAVIGFSQGCMMALYALLRRPAPCAAIIGYSGALIAPDQLQEEIQCRPPVCLIHGDADGVVPFAALDGSVDALKANKVPVERHARTGLGHGIDPEGIEIAKRFLKTHLK
jgi:phospholipase/carboxylesterase